MTLRIKNIFFVLSLAVLVSCVGTDKSMIEKNSVSRVNSDELPSILLKSPYSFKITPSDDSNGNFAETKRFNRQITISKGDYKAIGRNQDGMFYGGPPFCMKDSEYKPRWCGLFIYHSNPETAYIFYHLRTPGSYQSGQSGSMNDQYGVSSALAAGLNSQMDARDLKFYTLMLKYPITLSELDTE